MDLETIRTEYESMCRDLNMDIETTKEAWLSYMHIRRHYVLEGDQLHWLACSLYVACRTTTIPTISGTGTETCNSISLDRLLKSANNLQLIVFFDKLRKWQDMANLPEILRKKIGQLGNSFEIVSIVYQKYIQMFTHLYGQVTNTAKSGGELNPKLLKNKRSQQSHITQHDLYILCWSLFSLTKSKFPAIANDLVSAYHLLVACMDLFYMNVIQSKLNHLLKGTYISPHTDNGENETSVHGYSSSVIDELCSRYSGRAEDCRTIYEHYLKTYLKRLLIKSRLKGDMTTYTSLLHPIEHFQANLREINRYYDEIVLTRCVIDERIFFTTDQNGSGLTPLYDLVTSLNENRTCLKPKTPLTNRSRYVLGIDGYATPISIANQMLAHIAQIIGNLISAEPSTNLQQIIKNQVHLDSLVQRVSEWKQLFYQEYAKSLQPQTLNHDTDSGSSSSDENTDEQQHQLEERCRWSKGRMDMSIKLFYHCLDEILTAERKHLQQNHGLNEQVSCTEACNKLLMKDEFIKSLFALCLDLILRSYHDKQHDYKWILNLYQLDSFLFVKIIEIFIQAIKPIRNSREFIKHLNSMEEELILHMAWADKSQIWNEIDKRGILIYDNVKKRQQTVIINPQTTTPTHATGLYVTNSPISQKAANKSADSLSFRSLTKRSKSDNMNDWLLPPSPSTQKKNGPYLMFYRKLYTFLLRSRHLDQILICCIYLTSKEMRVPLTKSKSISEHSYASSNGKINVDYTEQSKSLTWAELTKIFYKGLPGAEEHVLRSVLLSTSDTKTNDESCDDQDACSTILTPSKPAGTRIRIGNESYGDISNFYSDIFFKQVIDTVQCYCETTKTFCEFPRELLATTISNQNIFSSPRKIQVDSGGKSSIIYSTKPSSTSLLAKLIPTNNNTTVNQMSPKLSVTSSSPSQPTNVLSSSIQTGQAQITTTKTRTPNGKFITIMTGSTAAKTPSNLQQNGMGNAVTSSSYEQQIIFGKSSANDLEAINSYLTNRYKQQTIKAANSSSSALPNNSIYSTVRIKRSLSDALLEQEDEIEEIILDGDNTVLSPTIFPIPKQQQNGTSRNDDLNSITQKLLLLQNDRQRERERQQLLSPSSRESTSGDSNDSLTCLSTSKLPTP
ncbi:unnamed protein product, partial [Didymodactylos carnosus]